MHPVPAEKLWGHVVAATEKLVRSTVGAAAKKTACGASEDGLRRPKNGWWWTFEFEFEFRN